MPQDLELIQAAAFAGETSLTEVTMLRQFDGDPDGSLCRDRSERSNYSGERHLSSVSAHSAMRHDMTTKVEDFVIYGKVGSQAADLLHRSGFRKRLFQ